MKPLVLQRKASVLLGQEGLKMEDLPGEFQALFPDQSPKYIDTLSLMAGIAAGRIFRRGDNPPVPNPTDAVILGTAFGAFESSVEFDRQALIKGPNTVNPMDFPNTVANAAGSRIGIWLQLKGPNITLTNGGTSFIDALGFAWEGMNGGLFQSCLVGAAEKIPEFLKKAGLKGNPSLTIQEGAFLMRASGSEDDEGFLQVEDYASAQWKPDGTLPAGSGNILKSLLDEAEWIGLPMATPVEKLLPEGVFRFVPNSSILELGLNGRISLEHFLSSPNHLGVLGAVAAEEKRISLVKIARKKRSQ